MEWRRLAQPIEVIYTHGVFRPAAPLDLELREGQHVIFLLLEYDAEWEPCVEDKDVRQWCTDSDEDLEALCAVIKHCSQSKRHAKPRGLLAPLRHMHIDAWGPSQKVWGGCVAAYMSLLRH
jgi:predicted DNA-binding antitoxin AbrB/MazE fold protein